MNTLTQTAEFIKKLTGISANESLLDSVRGYASIIRQGYSSYFDEDGNYERFPPPVKRMSDEEIVAELSKIRFIKIVIDKSNDKNYNFRSTTWFGKDANNNEYMFHELDSEICGVPFVTLEDCEEGKIKKWLLLFDVDIEAEYSGKKTEFIDTKSTAKLFVKNEKIYVLSKYNKQFASLAKNEGGKWDESFWVFAVGKAERIIEIVEMCYPVIK